MSRGIIFGFLLLPALVWAQPAPLAITHVTVMLADIERLANTN